MRRCWPGIKSMFGLELPTDRPGLIEQGLLIRSKGRGVGGAPMGEAKKSSAPRELQYGYGLEVGMLQRCLP